MVLQLNILPFKFLRLLNSLCECSTQSVYADRSKASKSSNLIVFWIALFWVSITAFDNALLIMVELFESDAIS